MSLQNSTRQVIGLVIHRPVHIVCMGIKLVMQCSTFQMVVLRHVSPDQQESGQHSVSQHLGSNSKSISRSSVHTSLKSGASLASIHALGRETPTCAQFS